MRYWLMKSEPDEFSIDDLAAAKNQTTPWFGVRNYTARNFMRDQMRVGDRAFFYHSSCPEPGIAGIAEVSVTFDDGQKPFVKTGVGEPTTATVRSASDCSGLWPVASSTTGQPRSRARSANGANSGCRVS